MGVELRPFDPSTVAAMATELCLTPAEVSLLDARHPFRAFGEWCGIATFDRAALAARLVASVDRRQQHDGRPVGCIGFVRLGTVAEHAPAAHEGVPAALDAAIDWLVRRGVTAIRGPVDFSTWYGHRAVVIGAADPPDVPRFPLEPVSGPAVANAFLAEGFVPAHRAVSCAISPAEVVASSTAAVARIARAGGRDRPLDRSQLDAELRLLHDLSSRIFRTSWGFSELSFAEFDALYRPLTPMLDVELVRILELDGAAAGFAFALPHSSDADGAPSAVVKTLGVLPEILAAHPGAGAALTGLVHAALRRRGVTHAVHALMAEGSMAHRLSMRWGRQIRSYATFERITA